MNIPTSAHPPVIASAKDPGSGATFEPEELVLCQKLNESTLTDVTLLGLTFTLIGEAESLM
jgi:hypothetical protein